MYKKCIRGKKIFFRWKWKRNL